MFHLLSEEYESNDDNPVVSNDAKHMKKITNKTTKNVDVKDEDDDDSSHFSQLSSTMLQSEPKSPHISQLSPFNSLYSVQPELLMRQKQKKKQKKRKTKQSDEEHRHHNTNVHPLYHGIFTIFQCCYLF